MSGRKHLPCDYQNSELQGPRFTVLRICKTQEILLIKVFVYLMTPSRKTEVRTDLGPMV